MLYFNLIYIELFFFKYLTQIYLYILFFIIYLFIYLFISLNKI